MTQRVLITGSSGLVGAALTSALRDRGLDVVWLDLRASGKARGDVRDRQRMHDAAASVDGIVHLAAISRVAWGQQDPELCWETNVDGLRNALDAAASCPQAPWLVFASSREVYGQPESLPVTEAAPRRPVNIYGRTKLEGERLVAAGRRSGVRACTVRLSNVYGSTEDHADRVIPSFAHASALGAELRVDGLDRTFDFTHVDDVVRGFVTLIEILRRGASLPPPIHFVSGRPTSLGELARLAARLGHRGSPIRPGRPRDFDVSRFVGDPSRARRLLRWEPSIPLEEGVARLVEEFRELIAGGEVQEVVVR